MTSITSVPRLISAPLVHDADLLHPGALCRRQMDGLKDAMNAAAMAGSQGVPAKRIASEVDRQYILTQEDKPEAAGTRPFPQQPHQAPGEPLFISGMCLRLSPDLWPASSHYSN